MQITLVVNKKDYSAILEVISTSKLFIQSILQIVFNTVDKWPEKRANWQR